MAPAPDADVRVWFVSSCIFAFTISCSLIVLLAMETTSSDLLFTQGSDIYKYAVASAVLASTILIGSFLSIISVWFHLRKIQLPSILGMCTFTMTIGFTIYWSASLAGGKWNSHMENEYLSKYWEPFQNITNDTTLVLASSSPASTVHQKMLSLTRDEIHTILYSVDRGHQLTSRSRYTKNLADTCPYAVPTLHCCGWDFDCEGCNITTRCKKAAEAEASDFAIKVIVICILIIVLVGICVGITAWRNCGRLKESLASNDE